MKATDIALGILVTVIWGSNFSVIELGLESLDPNVMTTMRFVLSAFPLILFVKRPRVPLAAVASYGAIFGAGLWWVVNLAMFKGMSPGLSSLVLQFSAFFTILLSAVLLREKIRAAQFASTLVALGGLLAIIVSSDSATTTSGTLLVLLAACSWSACNIIVKVHRPGDMLAFIIWSSAFSAAVLVILTLWNEGAAPFGALRSLNATAVGSLLFQSYVTTIFGYAIWNSLMRKYPAAVVAPLSLIVPVSGLITSRILFDEQVSTRTWIGIGLVLLGIAMFVNSNRLSSLLQRPAITPDA